MVSLFNYLTPARQLDFPPAQEAVFRDEFARESLRTLRVAALLGAILYAAFGLLNPWTVPTIKVQAWFVQYAVVVPLLLVTWLATFVPYILERLPRLLPLGIALDVLVAGGGIIFLTALTHGSDIGALAYSGVLVLVVMFSYTAARTLFVRAALINLLLFIAIWWRRYASNRC